MLVDGHMHLENGPLTKGYVMEFINEAYKQGFDRIQILDHTHRFKEFEVIYQGVKEESVSLNFIFLLASHSLC